MMLHFLLLPAALALTPPLGWTLASPERAERVQGSPDQGEILEFSGSDGSPSALALLLVEQGLSVQQSSLDGDRLNLLFADGYLGRAVWDAAGSRWLVLRVASAHAPQMDPDALLLSVMAPSPSSSGAWGVPETLDGGQDGSPWGAASASEDAPSESGWLDSTAVQAWAQDPQVLGTWECSILMGGAPAQLTFTFEADGTVRLEHQVSGRTEHHVGQWATRGTSLQLQSLPGVDLTAVNTYQALGGTLRFTYDRTRLTLYRR